MEIAHLARKEDADVIVFDNDLSPGQIGALERMINKELGLEDRRGREGPRPLRADPRHLRHAAQTARGQAPGRAGADGVHLSAADEACGGTWSASRPERARASARAARAKCSSKSTAASSASASPTCARRSRIVQERKTRLVAAAQAGAFHRLHRRLHQRRQEHAVQHADERPGRMRTTSCSPRWTPRPARWRIERGTRCCCPTPSASSATCRTTWWHRFKATLEEAVHADLLLHVLDVGHPHAEQQFQSVHEVLDEIGVKGKPEILLLNKIDTDEGEAA